MKRTLRKQKSGYAISLLLLALGATALFAVLWRVWSQLTLTSNPFSTFWATLWTDELVFFGFTIKLAYVAILASTTLLSGILLFILSRQWLPLAGKTVKLQCPFCKKTWKTSPDKALVHCPHCRQLIHPTLVDD